MGLLLDQAEVSSSLPTAGLVGGWLQSRWTEHEYDD